MVAYGELDPAFFIEQAKLLNEALCRQGTCPRLVFLPNHSHMSEVYAINTSDMTLGGPLMEFVNR